MLLISTTCQPATDLGYLLHKNPGRVYEANVTFGTVRVFFPEAESALATAALVLDIDPVQLVRGKKEAQGSLGQYVNDRPYVASSFVSVAIIEAFGTALTGRSKERQELADTPIPLQVRIPVLRCRWDSSVLQRLFEPLGYQVQATRLPLDDRFPEWGESRYYDVTLSGTLQLCELLRHLYILLPVLDASKHYYMDEGEVEKLMVKGKGWLPTHPERAWIVRAYLGRKPSLERSALEQLANAEEALLHEGMEQDDALAAPAEDEEPKKVSLHRQRHDRILELVRVHAPKSVVDLGCGDGKLIRQLIKIPGIERIVGMDVAYYEIEKAIRKLNLEDASPRQRERVQLLHGSLMYRDERLHGFDVCTVVEVVEHLDPPRLAAFERVVFLHASPRVVILTTPNREYNEMYNLQEFRHGDHRFEWTRAEFESWASRVAETYRYQVRFEGIGESHETLGSPSQMAVFSK